MEISGLKRCIYWLNLSTSLKLLVLLHLTTNSLAQLVTLDKGGNVGVNFAGFSAGAGLGGLLTGDTTGGGLHAYAQTPYGQRAGAGLAGNVNNDGSSAGGLYAGAQATGDVAAAATLDGAVIKTYSTDVMQPVPVYKYVEKQVQTQQVSPPESVETPTIIEKTISKNYIRRPYQRKRYTYINTSENPLRVIKITNVDAQQYPQPQPQSFEPIDRAATTYYTGDATLNKNGNLFNDIFNIPISTLKAVNQLVNNVSGSTSFAVSKEVSANAAASENSNIYKSV